MMNHTTGEALAAIVFWAVLGVVLVYLGMPQARG